MANGPEQGQPEGSEEVNLADDETPSPRGHDLQLERLSLGLTIGREGVSGSSEFAVRGPLHRAVNLLVNCVAAVGVSAAAVGLCHLVGADGRVTLAVGAGAGLLVFASGLLYMTDYMPFRRPPTQL